MSVFDKVKEFAESNPDKVDQAIEKIGDLIDAQTDGKFSDKVDQVEEIAKDKLHGH